MNELRAAIVVGLEDTEQGETESFTGDQFAIYLPEETGHQPQPKYVTLMKA